MVKDFSLFLFIFLWKNFFLPLRGGWNFFYWRKKFVKKRKFRPLILVYQRKFSFFSLENYFSLFSGGKRKKVCLCNLVDSASSHMLVLKIKPCMSKYKRFYCETADGSLKQLWFLWKYFPLDNCGKSRANTWEKIRKDFFISRKAKPKFILAFGES